MRTGPAAKKLFELLDRWRAYEGRVLCPGELGADIRPFQVNAKDTGAGLLLFNVPRLGQANKPGHVFDRRQRSCMRRGDRRGVETGDTVLD